ncbi:MAG: DUF1854 domain-containing protein [Defluviitaleaceae bacterium]|nr:DUF1854 domain-containing protein [Defluviitaleaceae bacterium]
METMKESQQNQGIDLSDLGIMDLAQAEFYTADGGFTGLKYKGEDYKHIVLRRIMPIDQPMNYISIADHDNKEIAILKDVNDLAKDQRLIVERELDNRYYSPQVLDIMSVKDKLGYVYMEMRLRNKQGNEYDKSCAVKDVSRNIRMLSSNSVIIFDVDGNRYVVPDLQQLNKQSLRKLDSYLF